MSFLIPHAVVGLSTGIASVALSMLAKRLNISLSGPLEAVSAELIADAENPLVTFAVGGAAGMVGSLVGERTGFLATLRRR